MHQVRDPLRQINSLHILLELNNLELNFHLRVQINVRNILVAAKYTPSRNMAKPNRSSASLYLTQACTVEFYPGSLLKMAWLACWGQVQQHFCFQPLRSTLQPILLTTLMSAFLTPLASWCLKSTKFYGSLVAFHGFLPILNFQYYHS